ncbi:MAG TPA: aromatic ring-hydroxylating dioxygenase subunit alpha [Burkholderiales bacterium]|nr:aromatic ring-hydroxylating dioxygenase subunit alpha [Burkholderiales bacterium]
MSDLASTATLSRNTSQLPVSWYFDPRIHELEQKLLFAAGAGYVGHELMVPNRGDYYALEWLDNAKVLVHNDNGVELIGNICRHRQSPLLQGRGNVRNIVCPLHRWTYALDGTLLGAPHFPDKPCLDLPRLPLTNWHGLLFNGKRDVARDFAALAVAQEFDFSGYQLERVVVDELQCNWKTFIEVYLEDYHVEPYHPGLGGFVDIADLKWQYGDWYNVQTVGVNRGLGRPGTPAYGKWHEQVLRYAEGKAPRHGAIWLTYFPNIMLEWYPHVLVASTVLPRGPEACTNVVEFYYPEDIALFEPEFVEAEQVAYRETADEDIEICKLMTEGRRALYRQGRNDAGPYQSPMEDGMAHFHEFVRHQLDPCLK